MMNIKLQTKIGFAFLLLVYFIVAIQPWKLFFLNDDFVHIPLSTQTIWVHFQFFRPIPNIVTALEVKLFGNQPFGFHITSIILHIVGTVSVVALCRQMITVYSDKSKYENAPYLAGCLFFVYPFHGEPVMWVIGRIGILATICIVGSMIFFLKRSERGYFYYLSLGLFIIGLFTYETSWILPVILTVFTISDYFRKKIKLQRGLLYLLPFWIVFFGFLIIRFIVLQRVLTEYEITGRNLTVTSIVAKFSSLFARTIVPPAESSIQFTVVFVFASTMIILFVLFVIRLGKISRLHILLIACLVISYLPTSSLGIDTHGSEGERHLYLPSVFWILLVTILIYELPVRIGKYVMGLLLVIYSVLFAFSASNYRHASEVAKKLLAFVDNYSGKGKIVAYNVPSNYKGALIFRSGFKEAVQWFYPKFDVDSVFAIPAERNI